MKNTILILLFITLNACNGQDKTSEVVKNKKVEKNYIEPLSSRPPMDFLDKKFQSNGFFLADSPHSFPTFSYLSKEIGAVSVKFIGKTEKVQDFWSIKNDDGYFAGKIDHLKAANNSKAISSLLNNEDYNIVASYLPSKYIKFGNSEDDDFELEENAITEFFIFKNSGWELLAEIETKSIPDDIFTFLKNLIENKNGNRSQISKPINQVQETIADNTLANLLMSNGTYKQNCSLKYPSIYFADSEGQFNFYTAKKTGFLLHLPLSKTRDIMA